jgi:hypothetical protein
MKKLNTVFRALLMGAGLCALASAMAAERDTPRTPTVEALLPAGATVWAGQVVGQTGGYAYPYVSASSNLTVVGVAQNSASSNGTVRVRAGIHGLKNAGDVTAEHTGADAYAYTNDTAWTAAASGSAAIGKIVAVGTEYVWVRCGP